MPAEAQYLIASVVLGLSVILIQALMLDLEFGFKWGGMGKRDDTPDSERIYTKRLARASANFGETFPFFAAAILACLALDVSNTLTHWGAAIYFWARLAYVPAYVFGIGPLRSTTWFISIFSIIALLIALIAGGGSEL